MGSKLPGSRKRSKPSRSIAAEMHRSAIRRNVRAARRIAEHELRAGVAEDEMDGLARELEVHRHRDQARAHDAVIGREIFGAIGGEDGDAIAACKAALRQRAGDAVRHGVEPGIAELARHLLAAEIDDRDLVRSRSRRIRSPRLVKWGMGSWYPRAVRRESPQRGASIRVEGACAAPRPGHASATPSAARCNRYRGRWRAACPPHRTRAPPRSRTGCPCARSCRGW